MQHVLHFRKSGRESMYLAKKLGAIAAALTLGLSMSSGALAAGELKGKTLTAFVNPSGPPMAFLTNDLFHPQGIDVDIILELQKRLGFELTEDRIYPIAHVEGMRRIKDKKADILGGGISYTVARTKNYDFSPIYFESSLALMYSTKVNPGLKTLADLKGKNVGVQRNSTAESFASASGAKIHYFESNILASFFVAMGRYDAIIYDRPPLADFATVMDELNLDLTDDVFGQDACQYALMLQKDSPYRALIAKTMEEMFMDGTIDKIKSRWVTRH